MDAEGWMAPNGGVGIIGACANTLRWAPTVDKMLGVAMPGEYMAFCRAAALGPMAELGWEAVAVDGTAPNREEEAASAALDSAADGAETAQGL